jgi:leucyl-tRNA synthetase
MTRLRTLALLLLTSSIFSCEKVITIAPPSYQSVPSIQCMLEPDSLPVVYFNKTVPYFDPRITFGELVIRGATIKISDGAVTDVLKLDSVYDRLYCQYNYYYKGMQPVQLNRNYTLSIVNGTEVYTASASTADLSKTTIDSTTYVKHFSDLYGDHEGVVVYFKDVQQQTNYYRYEMDRFVDTTVKQANLNSVSACLGKDSVYIKEIGRSVYSDQGQPGQQIKIVVEPAYLHKAGTQGQIRIQTIDKNAYDFFDQLDKQKLAQFNPFVEPLFLKEGQFGKRAIGYFSAMIKSNGSNFIYPE